MARLSFQLLSLSLYPFSVLLNWEGLCLDSLPPCLVPVKRKGDPHGHGHFGPVSGTLSSVTLSRVGLHLPFVLPWPIGNCHSIGLQTVLVLSLPLSLACWAQGQMSCLV